MAKKRLNKDHKKVILDWMIKEKLKVDEFEESKKVTLEKLAYSVNNILREKYPESDMEVLRKYDAAKKDTCLKFTILDTGQVYAVDFSQWNSHFTDEAVKVFKAHLVDVPNTGSNSNNILEGTEQIRDTFDSLKDDYEKYYKDRGSKINKYRTFVYTCKHLEDVEEIVVLPEHVRVLITEGTTALITMNSETIDDIKKDFS